MKNKRLLYFLALFAIILLTLVVALSDFLILYTPHYFALTPEEVLAFERAAKKPFGSKARKQEKCLASEEKRQC